MQKEKQRLTAYVHKVQEDSRQFTHDLIADNERLRALVTALQNDKLQLEAQLKSLQGELQSFESERTRLHMQLASIHEESLKIFERYTEVEQQSANLANLYVASYRLHATLDRQEVLAVMQEIIINLVGSEELAIFELDPDGQALSLVAHFGIDPAGYLAVPAGAGLIGRTAVTGESYIAAEQGDSALEENGLVACIPLKLENRVRGVIAIFSLLPQKMGLEAIDYELFNLLATHAAMALHCTGLQSRANAQVEAVA